MSEDVEVGPGADLSKRNLRGRDLRGVDLSGADLTRADLSGADLRDANLRDADLTKAKLREADLRGANLTRAVLVQADLEEANLRDAVLVQAELSGADLENAQMKYAKLQGSSFGNAKVWNADMSYADVSGADMAKVNTVLGMPALEHSCYTSKTQFPKGFDVPKTARQGLDQTANLDDNDDNRPTQDDGDQWVEQVLRSRWPGVRNEVASRCGMRVEVALRSVQDIGIVDSTLIMTFGDDRTALEIVADSGTKQCVEDSIKKVLGFRLSLDCVYGYWAVKGKKRVVP